MDMSHDFLPGRCVPGRRQPSEMTNEEFDALIEHSEALARNHRHQSRELTPFERLVADAIDRLPDEFTRVIEHVPVVVSNRGAEVHAYGQYYGATIARDRAATGS